MDSETPAQLPVVQEAQPSAVGQPIMFQMQPGQQQPAFIQVPAGHPATTPEGQPLQYFYIPVNQGAPGKPVESGQSVYIQGVHGEPVQQQPACPGGFDLNIDTGFLKSPLCFIKIAEFVSLLGAWASILKYLGDVMAPDLEHDANFFKGIMIFSWVVVILYLITYILSLPKTVCKCNRPSLFTITSVFFYFILFVLLLACTGNLVPKAVALGEEYRKLSSKSKISQYIVALDVALAFGFLSCILFVVDMVLNYREFQTQRAQETSPDQGQQGPPQRRVWDINYEYLHSPLFNIKLSEVSLLLGAWVCILRYFGTGSLTLSTGTSFISVPMEDSKADFFRGITVFAWVMVILLTLTFIFSFEKICSRSSPWTLLTLLFYFFLSILLIACCGNLTSRAVDLGKIYKTLGTESTSKALALFIGLGFGYFSWIIFLVDIYLIFKLYRQQRAQEFPYQQPAGQPVLQQPPVVIVAQGAGKQQFYQPVAHPGQQPSQYPGQQSSQYPGQQPYQYPGQQPVVIGAPTAPPPYSQNHPPPEPN